MARTYEEIKEGLLEDGFNEAPFVGTFIKGFVFERYVADGRVHEFKVFPFFAGEFTGLRLDYAIAAEGREDNRVTDDHLIKMFEQSLVNDILDITSNVCKKMINSDIDAPIIPAEAYSK